MKKTLIDKLCCPLDKGLLDVKVFAEDTEDNIIEGLMTCKTCQRYYPIVYGVPVMTPDEYREAALEKSFLDRWQKQLDDRRVQEFRLLNN